MLKYELGEYLDEEGSVQKQILFALLYDHTTETRNFIFEDSARLSMENHHMIVLDWIDDRVWDFLYQEELSYADLEMAPTDFLMLYNANRSPFLMNCMNTPRQLSKILNKKRKENPYLKLKTYK